MAEEHPLPKHIVRIKKGKSLLALVENAVKGGDNYLFRNLYADSDGRETDILRNGANSCAVFVSWLLLPLELIKKPHATVFATEKDLIASGWYEIKDLRPGAILIWEKKKGTEEVDYMHIGFCVSQTEAISNDSRGRGVPHRHSVDYGGARKVEKIYWHDELND